MVAQWASVASTVLMAAPTWLWCRAFMCWGRWVLEPSAAVMRSSAGLSSRKPWAMHHFMTAEMRCLTR